MNNANAPRGFTLRDLLVLFAVLAAVILLVLPGISSRCNSALMRKMACMNHLKQINLALLNHAQKHNRFPNAVTFGELPGSSLQTRQTNSSTLSIVSVDDPSNPTEHDLGPLYSWVVDILPELDVQSINDVQCINQAFDRRRVSFSESEHPGGTQPNPNDQSSQAMIPLVSNATLGQLLVSELICPSDDTIIRDRGNLSYTVNMGFTRWPGEPDANDPDAVVGTAWEAAVDGGQPNRFTWGRDGYEIVHKTGLMFTGTVDGDAPWDMHHSIASIRDGTSMTVMITENTAAGASDGGPPYGWALDGQPIPTNWAIAHPNFVGFITSSEVCGTGSDVDCCNARDLGATLDGVTGAGWVRANRKGSFASINNRAKHPVAEGGAPFPNSLHLGFVNVGMADGSVRSIRETIDGRIWVRLVTPDGESLPPPFRQTPINLDEFDDATVR